MELLNLIIFQLKITGLKSCLTYCFLSIKMKFAISTIPKNCYQSVTSIIHKTINFYKCVHLFCSFNIFSVRKPRNARTIKQQVEMVSKNIFSIIYGSTDYIKKYLLEGGFVLNLNYNNHKWKFVNGGTAN